MKVEWTAKICRATNTPLRRDNSAAPPARQRILRIETLFVARESRKTRLFLSCRADSPTGNGALHVPHIFCSNL